jgi:hypothetical protein
MKRVIWASALWSVCVCTSWALAASPLPVDRPTPPPCAADGTCYPNAGTWGVYACHWRQWPGEVLVPTPAGKQPTPAEGAPSELKPYETPTPEQEDAQAPPSTKKPESNTAAAPEAPPLPPVPEGGATPRPYPTPGAPSGAPTGAPAGTPQGVPVPSYPAPSYPTPSYPQPMRTTPTAPTGAPRPATGDLDPPPALPRQLSSMPRRGAVAEVPPASSLQQRPTSTRQPAGYDPPPALPPVFHSASL